ENQPPKLSTPFLTMSSRREPSAGSRPPWLARTRQSLWRNVMPQTSAFISYHHNDSIIGSILAEQLSVLAGFGEGRPALSCFLDAEAIGPGEIWQPVIDDNLRSNDWLLVIFTGKPSLYCGYEIGTFSQLNSHAIKKEPPDKRIIGLYDVPEATLPGLLTA